MKRILLKVLGKGLICISPLVWKIHFGLHQRIGRWVIKMHHRYDLDILPQDPLCK